MTTEEVDANELFANWQVDIETWTQFQHEVNHLTTIYPHVRFVWRGQANAKWGLQSSLYRALEEATGSTPTESDLVAAEKRLLMRARIDWRLDGTKSMQLFAQMQHVGVPTRFIDVTFNPLIAAWFAVARDARNEEASARLLVFTDTNRPLQLNSAWDTNTPRWHRLKTDAARRAVNWGTGLGRKVWRPPALHGRIPAQNAAFLLDGVPLDEVNLGNRAPWTGSFIRRFASIPMRPARVREDRMPESYAPVFTYRITPDAKHEIRTQLEERFGYSFSTVYADIEGMAEYAKRWPEELLSGVQRDTTA